MLCAIVGIELAAIRERFRSAKDTGIANFLAVVMFMTRNKLASSTRCNQHAPTQTQVTVFKKKEKRKKEKKKRKKKEKKKKEEKSL